MEDIAKMVEILAGYLNPGTFSPMFLDALHGPQKLTPGIENRIEIQNR